MTAPDPQNRVLIHVGKSGGTSIVEQLAAHGIVFGQKFHARKPVYGADLRYVIILRAPIPRAISAFNWRYHLVVQSGEQRDRFPGEHDILTRYGTLNALAEALYREDGSENPLAQGNLRSIHHLGESIAYYLQPLLSRVRPAQIEGVITQENLRADCRAILGFELTSHRFRHGDTVPPEMGFLSDRAQANLRRTLHQDFRCLEILRDLGKLGPACAAATFGAPARTRRPNQTGAGQ